MRYCLRIWVHLRFVRLALMIAVPCFFLNAMKLFRVSVYFKLNAPNKVGAGWMERGHGLGERSDHWL